MLQTAAPAARLGGETASAAPSREPGLSTGGGPLPAAIQAALEESLRVNLQTVRVHTDAHAHQLAERLSARAVTYGNHIFLGAGEQTTDLGLIGHEVAHVVQQQGAPTPQRMAPGQDDRYEQEAHRASVAVTHQEPFTVQERSTHPRVQRLGLSDALDYFADKANIIPGFRMFTIILGVNPINMSRVERSAANILRALVEFLPGGGLITQALDNYGIFDRVGAWVEQQIRALGMTGSLIKQAIDEFLDSLSWSDIFDLEGVWERAKRIFTAPIDRIIGFATGLVSAITKFIRDAILMPLAELAARTPGWDLLTAVLGENPITGEAVPRTAAALIGGFMKLIGQEEIWDNLQRANAVARAWAWFQGALSGVLGFVRQLPALFLQALQALELLDIVLVPRAFVKVARVFAGFLGQFYSWAGQQVLSLLQIMFEVVAPGAMPYIRRAAGAFRKIIENPIGFVGNLVRAGIQGFRQFAANFLKHLRTSLIGWLTGTLSGANIYIPQAFNLLEIIKFVLSVLGLTWQNIRQKLVRAIGETAVRVLEAGFDIVVTLVRQGPAAAWEKIQEGISNLREMVMEQIMTFVRDRVVQAAITRLLTSLNPAGAFIQAIIAIYNTIMFFVERLRQIAQVAMSFIDSITAIANGVIASAANRVEQTMAGLLTLVISFLARIAGLGRVSDAVVNVVNRVRAPIDRALDRVVDWLVAQARRLGRFIAQAGVPQDPSERLRLGMRAAVAAVNRFAGRRVGAAVLNPLLSAIKIRYGFQSLTVMAERGRWAVQGLVNPGDKQITEAQDESGPPGPGGFGYRIQGLGTLLEGTRAQSAGGRLGPPPAAPYPRAYIGNTPATLSASPAAIAQRYLTAFSGPVEAVQRFSLVIGVNAIDDLENKNSSALEAKVSAGAGVAYPWAIFGFQWMPAWIGPNNERPGTMGPVRIAYGKLSSAERTAALQHERASLTQAQIPYGAIRTRILQSSATGEFSVALRQRANDVFIHISDADTVNFNPQGEAGGGAEALFQRFDRILDAITANIRQHQGQGEQPSDGGPPIIATGGYVFELQADPSQPVAGQAPDLRTVLSAHLDMAVRSAMASVDPRSVYFPEPNLLVQVTPQTLRTSFGTGRLESRRLIENIERSGVRPRLIFDLSASLATTADRFKVEGASVVSNWMELKELTEVDLRAMISSSQSHGDQYSWAVQVSSSYGLPPQTTRRPLNQLWAVYFPVSPDLAGFDPAKLRSAVIDRSFTRFPKYGLNADVIQQALQEAIARQQREDVDAPTLAARIVDLARQGGLGLADALAAIFRRIGASR
jgi:hypothetical protein